MLWVAPVVQVVGMGRAYAMNTSPNCIRYCLKWDADAAGTSDGQTCDSFPMWTNGWEALGSVSAVANSLTCPDDGVNDDGLAQILTGRSGGEFFVYRTDVDDGFWIAFPNDINLADGSDPVVAFVAVKCGLDKDTYVAGDPDLRAGDDPCFTALIGVP